MSLPNTFGGWIGAQPPASTQDFRFAQLKSLTSTQGLTPSFSRASGASYFDETGVLRYAGLNVATYSEDFSNAAWVKYRGTVSANAASAPDGNATADLYAQNAGQTTAAFLQYTSTLSATAYTASVYAKSSGKPRLIITERMSSGAERATWFDLSGGTIGTTNAAHTASITNVGSGWYRCSITFTSLAKTDYWGFNIADTDNSFTVADSGGMLFWGAQLETGTTATTYAPTTAAASSSPRFDHVYNGTSWESRGLLIEGQRANALQYSSDMTNVAAWWGQINATMTAAAAVSPEGATTAYKLAETSANGVHNTQTPPMASSNGTTYTWSVYAKAAERSWIIINARDSADRLCYFNLSTGAVGTVAATRTATITNVGNGWYRCTVTGATDTGGTAQCMFYPSTGDAVSSYTGTTGSGVLIFGPQWETGAFATSYIRTTTNTAVTRSADVCQITGGSFSGFWNAAEGSFAVEYDSAGYASGGLADAFAASLDGNNFIRHSVFGASPTSRLDAYNASVAQTVLSSSVMNLGAVNRAASRYKLNDFAMSYNGNAAQLDAAGTLPSPTTLGVGSFAGSSEYLNGHIGRLRYFSKALTDKQLEDLGKPELSKTLDLQFATTKSLVPLVGPTPSFSRASTGWYFNASGVLTQAAINEARFDHTYDGSTWISRGLLVEEQRTNSVLRSDDFANASWIRTSGIASVTSNAVVAPDGTTTADKIVEDSATSEKVIYQSFSLTGPVTISCYMKAAGRNYGAIQTYSGTPNTRRYTVVFDLTNGSVTATRSINSPTGTSYGAVNVGNGWWRCWVKMPDSWVNGTAHFSLSNIAVPGAWSAGGFPEYLGDGASGIYLWGAQVEASSSAPSSYIPTTTGSVVRSADVCQITGSSFSGMWNASEGSVIAQFARGTQSSAGASPYSFFAGAESTDLIYLISSGGNESAEVWVGNVAQAQLNTGAAPAVGVSRKVALGLRANGFAASKDGAAVATDNAGTLTTCTQMKIGYALSAYTNGHIASLQYYTIRLPNRLLQTKSQ